MANQHSTSKKPATTKSSSTPASAPNGGSSGRTYTQNQIRLLNYVENNAQDLVRSTLFTASQAGGDWGEISRMQTHAQKIGEYAGLGGTLAMAAGGGK